MGNWGLLQFAPTTNSPLGSWGGTSSCRMFDTLKEAEDVLCLLKTADATVNQFNIEEAAKITAWKAVMRVVEVPDIVVEKLAEVQRLIKWCDDNPSAAVPPGGRENSLFYRGHEIGGIRKTAMTMFDDFIKETYG
jgi:hypothetical protein